MRKVLNWVLGLFGYQAVSSNSGLVTASDSLERRIYGVCHAAEVRGLGALSEAQRAVVLAWGGKGIIGNGGFKYFYEGEWRMAELAAAYRALGFTSAAEACEGSLSAFPQHTPPEDQRLRRDFLGPEAVALFDDLEQDVFDLDWHDLKV